jgi:7,8-dihydropterin-6-yl-methyl-4-(beta-D-ribofuranosyl)aminobenzene 5'-phosphate synthase
VAAKSNPVRVLIGGLHWTTLPDAEVERLATALHRTWRVRSVAPGHCTGEYGFAALHRVFGREYRYAGLGTVLEP